MTTMATSICLSLASVTQIFSTTITATALLLGSKLVLPLKITAPDLIVGVSLGPTSITKIAGTSSRLLPKPMLHPQFGLVPVVGVEPTRPFKGPQDFKSCASAISPHRQCEQAIHCHTQCERRKSGIRG